MTEIVDSDQRVDAQALRRAAETHRVIGGRRWRVSDPALEPDLRQQLVNALMDARRAVKHALGNDDEAALDAARRRVGDAKVALGERGPKWWTETTEADVATRIECGRRSLDFVGEGHIDGATFNDDGSDGLRQRFRL